MKKIHLVLGSPNGYPCACITRDVATFLNENQSLMNLSATEMRSLVPENWNMKTTCGVIAAIVETDEANHFTVTELFNNKLSKKVQSNLVNLMKKSFPDAVIEFAA